jgi:hypothetical protein
MFKSGNSCGRMKFRSGIMIRGRRWRILEREISEKVTNDRLLNNFPRVALS